MTILLSFLALLVFLAAGMMLAFRLFKTEFLPARLMLGGAFGLALLIWLPAICAFITRNFGVGEQIAAVVIAVGIGVALFLTQKGQAKPLSLPKPDRKTFLRRIAEAAFPAALWGYVVTLLIGHTLRPGPNGQIICGQSTWGDLPMHLGFITSVSEQQTFPPMYSLLAGKEAVGYPFLSDTVSSTFYTLGTPLRFATILPEAFAMAVLFFAVYLLAKSFLGKVLPALFAFCVFLVGGGFGFSYILDMDGSNEKLKEMLGAFYHTPTNYNEFNMRWSNLIADMLIPQRATLFGYALLFPCLYLLKRAVFDKKSQYFLPLGVLAGCLPLIHTHSFMALGVLAAVLFIIKLIEQSGKYWNMWFALPVAAGYLAGFFPHLAWARELKRNPSATPDPGYSLFYCLLIGLVLGLVVLFAWLGRNESVEQSPVPPVPPVPQPPTNPGKKPQRPKNLPPKPEKPPAWHQNPFVRFLCFGGIALVLAAPQLFGFALKQTDGEGFFRPYFNWVNSNNGKFPLIDHYWWFYLKNIGLPFAVAIPAFLAAKKPLRSFALGATVILALCEIIVFQPNSYDNNKLLYIWYFVLCVLFASLGHRMLKAIAARNADADWFQNTRRVASAAALALCIVFIANLSGVLTLAREQVSELEQFGAGQVAAVRWINQSEDVAPDALFLTADNFNNAVSTFTGRNIVCGSASILWFHGTKSFQSQNELGKELLQHPSREALLAAEVDYIYIGDTERGNNCDEAFFEANFPVVYDNTKKHYNGVTIYRVI